MCNCKPILIPKTKDLVKGTKAILNNVMRRNLASSETVAKRLEICYNCPELNKGIINQCSKCSCIVEWKVRQQTEACPIAKWQV